MSQRFKITFDAPADVEGNLQLVIDENKVQSGSGSEANPVSGPLTKVESPDIAVNTMPSQEGTALQLASGSAPDVTIFPTATSTTGQGPRIYRTSRASITLVWSETVTGFTEGDIQLRVVNSRLALVTVPPQAHPTLLPMSFFPPGPATTYRAQVVFPPPGTPGAPERGVLEVSVGQGAAQSTKTMNAGPPAKRILLLEWDFSAAGGVTSCHPSVTIIPPAGNPVIPTYNSETTNYEATIGFLWNQSVGLGDFTNEDVTFTDSTGMPFDPPITMSDVVPAAFGDIREGQNRYFEGTLTLPDVMMLTAVTVTVRADAASNGAEPPLSGPEEAVTEDFNYLITSTGTLDVAPTGTTMICSADYTVQMNDWLVGVMTPGRMSRQFGGAFYGVSDLTLVDGHLYGVVQILKESVTCRGSLDPELEAGCALFKVSTSDRDATCTASRNVIDAYDSILEGPRSLVEVGNTLYFFNGSHYAYIHGRGTETLIYDPDKSPTFGRFYSYNHPASDPTLLGTVWRSEFGSEIQRDTGDADLPDYGIHNSTASPIVHDGTSFHMVAGFGSTDTLQLNPNRRFLFIRAPEQPDSPFENRIPRFQEDNLASQHEDIPILGDIIAAFQEPAIRRVLSGGRPPIIYDEVRNEFLNIEPWSANIPPDDGNQLWAQEVELSRTITLPSGRKKVVVRRTESNIIVRDFYETRDEPFNTELERYPIGVAPAGIPVRPVGAVGSVSATSSLITASEANLAATNVANWNWVSYASQIEPIIDLLQTNDVSAWDVLLQFASITHSILLFHEEQVFFKPRLPARAELTNDFSNTDLDLTYQDAIRAFPVPDPMQGEIAYAVVNQEVITYTGVTDTELTGITRGVEQTFVTTHPSVVDNKRTRVVGVDHVLTDDRLSTPIEQVQIVTDFPSLYNQVEIRYADDELTHFQEVEGSVDLHGPRSFTIDANMLTTHQVAWVEWLADVFLDTFGQLQHLISFDLLPNFDIEVGDYTYLKMSRDDIRRIGQIVNVTQNPDAETTSVQIRTITP